MGAKAFRKMDEPQSDFQDHKMGAVRMTTLTAYELAERLRRPEGEK